ncbi:hypothetical protein K490DRAFT_30957 [Saccharata proteae CBS 121410]|uniref:Distal membrane-arm assembly complex protein 1-like domain-containing protein n=1 Tax=Saccharata proteae CBS 121410 TaxID=1314787 RepID=A0A9P4I3U9_9PEZI|nr:hypothetical protein K490DRAFT_30957 [Saccharata proteae CBS 121410]
MVSEQKKEFEDCTPCRILGASAFIGLGVFSYVSGHSQLTQQQAAILKSNSIFGMRSRRNGITGLASVFLGLGLYRLMA